MKQQGVDQRAVGAAGSGMDHHADRLVDDDQLVVLIKYVERDGRSLLAVVLGASSVRERNELTAQLFLRGLAGELAPTGQTVLDIKDIDADPVDMSPLICGKKAKTYVKQRMADFPYGLKGKPSFLNDKIVGPTYVATELGKTADDIPLPRPRPDTAPAAVASN